MTIRILASTTFLLILAGCEEPAPFVTGFNGSSVEIQQSTIFAEADPSLPEIQSEAIRICGKVGKTPEYASSTLNYDTGTTTHLFLCL